MKCNQHPENDVIAVCVNCSNFLCEDCKIKLNGRNYCKKCANERIAEDVDNKPENFENYIRGFISDVHLAKNKLDGFVKDKGIDKEVQKFVNNVGDKGRDNSLEEPFDKIRRAKDLFDMDAITDEEFVQLKYKYINQIINSNKNKDPLIEIKNFKDLFDVGTITQEEFEEIKKIYLDL